MRRIIELLEGGWMSVKEVSYGDLPDTYRVTIGDGPGSGDYKTSSIETDKPKKAGGRSQGAKTCDEAVHHPVRLGQLSGREYS